MDETRIVKVVKRPAKSKPPKNRSIYDEVGELNGWNPFQRVNPAVLEKLHRKLTKNKQLLDEYEESPI